MDNIYIALDFPTRTKANNFLTKNDLHGVPIKVGMELFYREGPAFIYDLKENNHKVFLDLKLHDIPNTVHRAMKNLAALHVDIVNVHAQGGAKMIYEAKEGLLSGAKDGQVPSLIAVTVLTSFDEITLRHDLRMTDSINDYALHLANLSKENGADGVVCSAKESKQIKEVCGADFLTITPGIRLKNNDTGDQKRVATPKFAKKNGADILVIGRPITQAKNPRQAYEQFIEEWTTNE